MTLDKDGKLATHRMVVAPSSEQPGDESPDARCLARRKPTVHAAFDAPLCQSCREAELSFFDVNCPSCQELLDSTSTCAQVFAILRQWTPQTQQNLEPLIRQMLQLGINVNDRDGLTDMTLLHYVAKAGANGIGDVDEACRMTTMLLQHGADVFVRCRWTNMTPLHYAVFFDASPVVRILLQHSNGIDVDSKCTAFEHGTALHIAAANLAYESAKILLQYHASPETKDALSRTPLDCLPDCSNFDGESDMGVLVRRMQQLLQADIGPDHRHELFTDDSASLPELGTLGLAIGDRVVVGGVKYGVLRFCGPTRFSAGVWAGIELEEPAGKNDGSVAGVSYFKCAPKYGIFAPLNKLGKPGVFSPPKTKLMQRSPLSVHAKVKKKDMSGVQSRIDSGLRRSMSLLPPGVEEQRLDVGDRVIVGGQKRGIIRFSGPTAFAPGWWYGLELERPVGKNDGTVDGTKYFSCKPRHGVFAPPSRVQKFSEFGSRESLDAFSSLDRVRRLSAGGANSQHASAAPKKSFTRHNSKSKLQSISEQTSRRPKIAGTIGQMTRSLSAASMPTSAAALDPGLVEGAFVVCNSEPGVLRYVGPVEFADGTWLGVELRSARGKNDGAVQGRRYFTCASGHGLLVRPSKVVLRSPTMSPDEARPL